MKNLESLNVVQIYSSLDDSTMNVISSFNPDAFSLGGVIQAVNNGQDELENLLLISLDSPAQQKIARVETSIKSNFYFPRRKLPEKGKKKLISSKKEGMYNSSITEEFEDLCSFPQPPFKRIKKEENKKKIEELIQNIHVLEETYDGTEKSSLLEMASLKSQQMLSMALGDWRPSKSGPLTPVLEEKESMEALKELNAMKPAVISTEKITSNKNLLETDLEKDQASHDSIEEIENENENANESKELSDSTLHNCPSIESLTWSEYRVTGDSNRMLTLSPEMQPTSKGKHEISAFPIHEEETPLIPMKSTTNYGSISSETDSINESLTSMELSLSDETAEEMEMEMMDYEETPPMSVIGHQKYRNFGDPYYPVQMIPLKSWKLVRPMASSAINRRKRQMKIQQDNAILLRKIQQVKSTLNSLRN